MTELTVPAGAADEWILQGRTRLVRETPVGYLDSDVLACKAWPGDDRPAVFSPAVAWTDAPTCKFKLSVAEADTLAAGPGRLRLLTTATRDGRTFAVALAGLTITAAPGEALEPPSYCTAEDLRNQCSWIDQIADVAQDQTGFAQQRGEAREWLDGLILNHRPAAGGYFPNFPDVPTWGAVGLLEDPWLRAILDAGGLVLTGPRGRKAVRICACYALALIFRTKCAPDSKFAGFAAEFERRAQKLAKTAIVEIDTNGDGLADMPVPLCNAVMLRG